MIPWSRYFCLTESLIWIEVEGIPQKAWCNDSLLKITIKWGHFVHFDDSQESIACNTWVCVRSSYMNLMSKTLVVVVDGISHSIRVKEVNGRLPNFVMNKRAKQEKKD